MQTKIPLLQQNHRSDEAKRGPARGDQTVLATAGKLRPSGGRAVGILSAIGLTGRVCGPEAKGRILNYDQKGRSLRLLMFKRPVEVRQVSVLSQLRVGENGELIALDLPESVQNHLMHMGFVPGAVVTALRRAPAGDPTVYGVDGMEIALRHETAEAIRVHGPVDKALLAAEREASVLVSEPEVPEFVEAAR